MVMAAQDAVTHRVCRGWAAEAHIAAALGGCSVKLRSMSAGRIRVICAHLQRARGLGGR